MTDDQVTINLSRDQALVLSDWLDRMMGTGEFDGLVNRDPAVWTSLYRIAGTLDRALPETFDADYSSHLRESTARLLAAAEELDA